MSESVKIYRQNSGIIKAYEQGPEISIGHLHGAKPIKIYNSTVKYRHVHTVRGYTTHSAALTSGILIGKLGRLRIIVVEDKYYWVIYAMPCN